VADTALVIQGEQQTEKWIGESLTEDGVDEREPCKGR